MEKAVSPTLNDRSGRIPALDGLRAVAIALVFGRHAIDLPAGWAGVDIFFVLSGFLITGILRRDRKAAHFWKRFYIKRATRILPALLVAFCLAAIFFPIAWKRIGLVYALSGGDFGNVFLSNAHSLAVMWSLAIEEHFYLVWPFAVRYLRRRQLIWLSTALVFGEPILRLIATPFCSSIWPIYYLTPFRLDGLAAGSLLALLLERERSREMLQERSGLWAVCLTAGLVLLMQFRFFQRDTGGWLFNSIGYSWIVAASFFAIAFLVLNKDTWLHRLLSRQSVVLLGTVSYGFYLYHVVVVELFDHELQTLALPHAKLTRRLLAPVPFAIAFAVSWISFRYFEKPITAWGHRQANVYKDHLLPRFGIVQAERAPVEIS